MIVSLLVNHVSKIVTAILNQCVEIHIFINTILLKINISKISPNSYIFTTFVAYKQKFIFDNKIIIRGK